MRRGTTQPSPLQDATLCYSSLVTWVVSIDPAGVGEGENEEHPIVLVSDCSVFVFLSIVL